VCLISRANLKDFLIIGAKKPVSYIGGVLYRGSTVVFFCALRKFKSFSSPGFQFTYFFLHKNHFWHIIIDFVSFSLQIIILNSFYYKNKLYLHIYIVNSWSTNTHTFKTFEFQFISLISNPLFPQISITTSPEMPTCNSLHKKMQHFTQATKN
jgi:hypothetical protein